MFLPIWSIRIPELLISHDLGLKPEVGIKRQVYKWCHVGRPFVSCSLFGNPGLSWKMLEEVRVTTLQSSQNTANHIGCYTSPDMATCHWPRPIMLVSAHGKTSHQVSFPTKARRGGKHQHLNGPNLFCRRAATHVDWSMHLLDAHLALRAFRLRVAINSNLKTCRGLHKTGYVPTVDGWVLRVVLWVQQNRSQWTQPSRTPTGAVLVLHSARQILEHSRVSGLLEGARLSNRRPRSNQVSMGHSATHLLWEPSILHGGLCASIYDFDPVWSLLPWSRRTRLVRGACMGHQFYQQSAVC